jgi:hypothetical protein
MIQFRSCILVQAVALLTAGCQQAPDRQPAPTPSAAAPQPSLPALPITEPPLDRAALLLAVVRAGSAAVAGEDDRESQRALDGKRFELRMRFGCGGPADKPGRDDRSWSFDEKRHVLRIHVAPEISKDLPLVQALSDDAFEAVEGFRIWRPWLLSAACPRVPEASPSAEPAVEESGGAPSSRSTARKATSPVPFIGIAQFFTDTDARTHRRGDRAYEVTKTLDASVSPSAEGYDLVLAGRLKQLLGGRVIACRPDDPASPPSCVIAAEFDTVTMERADNAEQLARWSSG